MCVCVCDLPNKYFSDIFSPCNVSRLRVSSIMSHVIVSVFSSRRFVTSINVTEQTVEFHCDDIEVTSAYLDEITKAIAYDALLRLPAICFPSAAIHTFATREMAGRHDASRRSQSAVRKSLILVR